MATVQSVLEKRERSSYDPRSGPDYGAGWTAKHQAVKRYWESLPKQLPESFGALAKAEQLEALLGYSLGQAYEVVRWNVNELPSFRLSIWNQVRHDLWNIAFRTSLESNRSREREKVLAALVADLPGRYGGK